MTEEPLVSIIIPTYNSQSTIGVCLESIFDQDYSQVEVLIVDGGSTDYTTSICKNYDVDIIEEELGMAASRVRGANEANGEYLFHLDSDMELTEGVVKECVQLMSDYDSTIIPEVNVAETYWGKCTDIGKSISRHQKVGHLRFISAEIYSDIGGHNPDLLYKEDLEFHELAKAEGIKNGYTTNHIRHHLGELSIFSLLSKRREYMKTLPEYMEHARIRDTDAYDNEMNWFKAFWIELRARPRLIPGYLFLSLCTSILRIIYEPS